MMMPLHRVATGLLLLVLALPGVNAAPDDYQEARRLFTQGSYPQALERTDAFLVHQPKDARARFLKGLILTEQGKQAEAIRIFSSLTEDFPELPEPYNNLAVLYAAQGQDEKARKALEMAIRTHPSYATAHENLGDVYAKMAREAYDKALQLDSSNTSAKSKLALVKELFSTKAGGQTLVKGTVSDPLPVGPKTAPAIVAAAPAASTAAAPTAAATTPPKPAVPSTGPGVSAAPASPSAKPADVPTDRSADANPEADVLRAVDGWARAWSSGDAKIYLAHYAPSFKPPRGQSRAVWEQARRDRVVKGKRINVQVQKPKVTFASPEEAVVLFRQAYQSETLKTSSMKKLTLVRSAGHWLISTEGLGR